MVADVNSSNDILFTSIRRIERRVYLKESLSVSDIEGDKDRFSSREKILTFFMVHIINIDYKSAKNISFVAM